MSTPSNAEVAALYEGFMVSNYASCAIAALVCFEYVITIHHEVDLVWKRKWSAATWIFVMNRYFLLASAIYLVAPVIPQICDNSLAMNGLAYLVYGAFHKPPEFVFTILRLYAIIEERRNKLVVTWTLILLSLTEFSFATYQDFTTTWVYVTDPVLGNSCYVSDDTITSSNVNHLFTAISTIGIVSAAFVLIVTLLKTARQVRQASSIGMKTSLSGVLLRDGSLFFFVNLIQEISQAISSFDSNAFNGTVGDVTIPLLNFLPRIMLSHFIINLRQSNTSGTESSANQLSARSSVHFRVPTMNEVIGNLGEPLDFEGDEAMQADVLDQNANAEQKDPADLESNDAIQLSTRLDSVGNLSRSATEDDTSSRFRVMKDGCKSL